MALQWMRTSCLAAARSNPQAVAGRLAAGILQCIAASRRPCFAASIPNRQFHLSARTIKAQIVTPRAKDFSAWYLDTIAAADLTDNGPVRGTVILKPHGFAIWDRIKNELDRRIQDTGHSNVYFPLLVPVSFLSKEAAHVDGFAKECAVVTHHRLRAVRIPGAGGESTVGVEPDPASALAEPLVIRPTSETIIWDAFSRWIQSHRDLPLLYNQWANVVRWELRTRPFLRTSEFLWQEGHTAHSTQNEAKIETATMLQVYKELCESVLAIPVITGQKSASERFAGAVETHSCEAMMQNGWALQAATSHFLGQNFAKAFNVTFTADSGHKEHVWASSWGASTRLVGGVIMTHSDDTGLVLPPLIAPVQVVVVPIVDSKSMASKDAILAACNTLAATLRAASLRCVVDKDLDVPPGARFFKWERKGVPLRIEIGARDLASGTVVMRDRLGGPRLKWAMTDGTIATAVTRELQQLQATLFKAAQLRLKGNMHRLDSYAAMQALSKAHAGETPTPGSGSGSKLKPSPFILAPWRDDAAAEAAVKAETKFTIRCFPDEYQGELGSPPRMCMYSKKPATHMALFARSF